MKELKTLLASEITKEALINALYKLVETAPDADETWELLQTLDYLNIIKRSHTSYYRGYVSRVTGGWVEPYEGRFGKGFLTRRPNAHSTNYSFVTYYIIDTE